MHSSLEMTLKGEIEITDVITGALVMRKRNAIHPKNCATVIARALSRDSNGSIFSLAFGNGGTFLNSSNVIVYRTPNTIGAATLYNQTYIVQVDDQIGGTPSSNSVIWSQSPTPAITSLIVVTALLSAGEPSGQAVADNITVNPDSLYTFDEIGLVTADSLLLTHVVFNPIEKTANRSFLITYTITISNS